MISKAASQMADELGEKSVYKLIIPAIALRRSEVSKSTTLKYISAVSALASGSIDVGDLPQWMTNDEAVRYLREVIKSHDQMMDEADQFIQDIIRKTGISHKDMIKMVKVRVSEPNQTKTLSR